MRRQFDIVVIGGGHAGAEAAWAASRLGLSTVLVSLDPTRIGAMSCNPAIGGLAKGQIVREIDALGGLMGLAIDLAGIQFRMLNRSKGPAVWGPRAQADKYKYAVAVQQLLATCPNLTILPGEVAELQTTSDAQPAITGVVLADGTLLACRAAIVTTGTFLRALMHTGDRQTEGGRVGEQAARGLSVSLARLGFDLGRLKTGTPPRLHRDSINFSAFELQPGDERPLAFSYLNEYSRDGEAAARPFNPPLPQIHCWLGNTNEAIHQIIRDNLHRAPMYSGQIHSTGPRYCPSIEDKVVRFADKVSHHLFLEPEGLDTPEIYVNGISTSLPADVQDRIVRGIVGLERAQFIRYGYAVEYDMVWPSQIRATTQTKRCDGLFLAGQINGTSGYEEAAAQGQLAGINAVQYVKHGSADFVLRRDQAYMGVLMDDLVTKPPIEPYRMFTSRAEHRLHLRSDNADLRLTDIGRFMGLVDDARWQAFTSMQEQLQTTLASLVDLRIEGTSATDLLRRPENTLADLALRPGGAALASLDPRIAVRIETSIKYEGYITRQDRANERMLKMEGRRIPGDFDYKTVHGLRNEARQKFSQFNPHSLGQALRISGITPADVTVLAIALDRRVPTAGLQQQEKADL